MYSTYSSSFKIIIFLWECGLVYTFTVVNFLYNTSAQYGSIVRATFLEGNATKKTLLEPILGLGVSYKFVKAAQTAAERRARVATLAAFLSASTGAVFGSSTAANGSAGAVVASHIAHMRNVLEMRGGSLLGSGVKGSKAK